MQSESSYDFPFISEATEADEGTGPALAESEPGDLVLTDETLYEATGDGMEKGDEIGTVHLEQRRTNRPGRTLVDATFVLDNGEVVRVMGTVPGDGTTWVGKGRVAVLGGTGKFKDRRGEIPVESVNPKRWG